MLPDPRPIKILTSLTGYGVYIPGALVQRQLAALHIPSKLYIVEQLLSAEKKKYFRIHGMPSAVITGLRNWLPNSR